MLGEPTAPAYVVISVRNSKQEDQQLTAKTYPSVVVTAVDDSFATCTASSIVDDGLYRDPCSDFDIIHPLANLLHYSAELMTECQGYLLVGDGMRGCGHDISASKVLVQVCPTYANIGWFDLHLASSALWNRNMVESKIFLTVESQCFHHLEEGDE